MKIITVLLLLSLSSMCSVFASAAPMVDPKAALIEMDAAHKEELQKLQSQLNEKDRVITQQADAIQAQELAHQQLQRQLEKLQADIQQSNSLIENQNSQMTSQNV